MDIFPDLDFISTYTIAGPSLSLIVERLTQAMDFITADSSPFCSLQLQSLDASTLSNGSAQ